MTIFKYIAAVTILLSGVSYGQSLCQLKILSPSGTVSLKAEVADDWSSRSRGLMFRKYLDKDSGMLFVFQDEDFRAFWMENTSIPLSIAYMGKDGVIDEIFDMEPFDSSLYKSTSPAEYALEMKQGWFTEHGIGPGCRVDISSIKKNKQ